MKILVVDDDPMAAELTAAILEDAGHTTLIVDGCAPALHALGGEAGVDLIVSDMNMPDASGLDLFRTLREQGRDVPFILLSGGEPGPLLQREPRIDACVEKNEDLLSTLGDVVARVLRRAGGK